jgi:hypothetical protein
VADSVSRKCLKVDEFYKRLTGRPVGYHGTATNNVALILSSGLRTSRGCFLPSDQRVTAAYFSPCIEYSAHPHYAVPHKDNNSENLIQVILKCRVNPNSFKFGKETMNPVINRIHP